MWRLARSGATAHLPGLVGPFIVVALAASLISGTGVLIESGVRSGGAGFLILLALSFTGTAMMLIVFVVSATVSLALRRRQRDFALLRAVGATRGQIRGLVAREVSLVVGVAAPLGALAGLVAVRPLAPILVEAEMVGPDFRMTFSPLPMVAAVLVLLPVVWLAARLATRQTLRAAPTTAVTQSVVEPVGIGRVRRISALVLVVTGLFAALSPLFMPGTLGSAMAASSAFVLVGAAAAGGPVLVAWLLDRAARLRGGPATRLALANTRGFSRRLTTVVVPLALALGVGTVQAATDDTLAAAGERQLAAGLDADLIVTGDLDDERRDALAALPGVDAAVPLTTVSARVLTDEDAESLGPLGWEPIQVRGLPAGDLGGMLDPGVREGDLAALDTPGTVAISRDARFDTGKGIGEKIAFRWEGDERAWATVVAVYDRGLGFGDYLVGQSTLADDGAEVGADTVLLRTDGPGVASAVADLGLTATDEASYVASVTASGDAARDLSALLLLLLVVFVVVAAANALVLSTAGRRDELVLLWRTGATRRQLVAMAGVEALIIGVLAWLIGTATVIPAILGVSGGLLGLAVPPVDLLGYGVLSLAVLLVPLMTVVPVVTRAALARR